MGRVLEISGTGQNVRIASYINDFIRHFISSQWVQYNRKRCLNRFRRTDFAVGVIQGFRSKLNQETLKIIEAEDNQSLMKIHNAELEEHIHYKYPRISRIKGRALKNNKSVLKDGISLGKELVVYKGIVHKNSETKLLN